MLNVKMFVGTILSSLQQRHCSSNRQPFSIYCVSTLNNFVLGTRNLNKGELQNLIFETYLFISDLIF